MKAIMVAAVLSCFAASAMAQERPHLESFQVGGGINDFTGSAASNLTKLGAQWDVRVGARLLRPLSVELAYVGTTHPIGGPLGQFTPGTSSIGSNGVEGLAALDVPLRLAVTPFVFGGVGYDHWSLSGGGQNNPQAIAGSDSTLVIPWGAGARYTPATHWDVDGRFTYRSELLDDMLFTNSAGQPNAGSKSFGNWSLTARVGYIF